jgi:dTDP-4-dehydrorhamnose 3,5-epimerase
VKFVETDLPGAYLVELEPVHDERGWFARAFCAEEFAAHGLNPVVAQCNLSRSHRAGTLRGLHWQAPPHAEAKLVRCIAGAIWDVIVDLRPGSPTRRRHLGVELAGDGRRALYVPEGFAHGFLTLADDSDVLYQMSAAYAPAAALGARWDDPAFGIDWPAEVRVISARDRGYPDYAPDPAVG